MDKNIFREIYDKEEVLSSQIVSTLERYKIEGMAIITMWCGCVGSVRMNPFIIDAKDIKNIKDFKEKIAYQINDNGFGAKEIKGAIVHVYAQYKANINNENIFTDVYVRDFIIKHPDYDGEIEEKEIEFAKNSELED